MQKKNFLQRRPSLNRRPAHSSVNYYPVFLNLEDKKTIVVGGGEVAERKVLSLLKSRADITVVSPSLTKRLSREKSLKTIRHLSRNYMKGDLKGAFLVIAATDSAEINKRVARDSPALVNVVDVPSECNFIAPSLLKRGPLIVAISTGGASPAFARTIRKELQQLYGPEFSGYLAFIKRIRAKALSEITEKDRRERFLKGLASKKILDTLRVKGLNDLKKSVKKKFQKLLADS